MTLAELNALSAAAAADALRAACGSGRWVDAMVAGRPYGSVAELLGRAEAAWAACGPRDWQEAFAHHPRIGEARAQAAVSATAARWSSGEQADAARADADVRQALAEANREYERRFGRIYIVCATGRSADEILADLRGRLANDPERELAVAAREQAAITALRLRKLLAGEPS